ncbi:MAG TPA: hypothetical protein VH598_14425 [Verrucomicrobiae bacterium]|nr:hypothetical protein [Verrucomicrobiae bacterium]
MSERTLKLGFGYLKDIDRLKKSGLISLAFNPDQCIFVLWLFQLKWLRKKRWVCRQADALYWWKNYSPVSRVKQIQRWSAHIWTKSANGAPLSAPAKQF